MTVLVSSTTNDQVARFDVGFQTLTLIDPSGKNATLLSLSDQPAEFVHLNGSIEPLTTANVLQGVYIGGKATISRAVFVCLSQVPGGGVGIANYSIVNLGPVVNLRSPITITGSSMALRLDKQVFSSAVFSSCWTTPSFQGSLKGLLKSAAMMASTRFGRLKAHALCCCRDRLIVHQQA